MKRISLILGMAVTVVALFTGCGETSRDNTADIESDISNEASVADDTDDTSTPNPMKETDADGINQTMGVGLYCPYQAVCGV